MSAWTQRIEPGPALLILVLALTPQLGYAAPSATLENSDQSTEIEYYPVADATGCYYNFEHYDEGDRIITNEPCLNCTCHNRMLMCYLRVCPFTKAIGQDCKVEKRSDQCCPVITCPDVHVQLLPHASTTPSTQLGHPNEYGCTIENLFYADGAKVPSNPNNPCEVCYCIRNKTACIIQDCTLTGKVVEGCLPVYVDGVCCPVRYNCEHPEIETTPRPLLTTTTTTLPPTSAPTDCIYNNEVYADGALVKKDVPCEQCYCMRGDIVCAVQECGPTPLDKVNCTALPTKEGQCCPDTYECENISEEDLTTLSYYEAPTTLPTIIEDDGSTTKASIPQITLADDQLSAETEGKVSESVTKITGDHTIAEETPVTESVTVEAFTSKINEAIEAVTSKVTEMIETVTSTFIGTEKDTTPSPEIITVGSKLESETTTIEAAITDKSEPVTEKLAEGQQPVTEHEEQTEHGVFVTEGIVQETQTPESDDQKLAVTIREEVEHIPAVTTEATVENVATEFGEPIVHDDHEDTDQEELPHEDENEVTEGSGIPTERQELGTTQAPELDTEDKHTRPIDQSGIEEKPHTTEQSEIEITRSPTEKLPHEDETQTVEGSGVGELEPIGTLAPKPDDREEVTEQPEVKVTEEPETFLPTTETSVGSEADVTGTLSTDISVEEHTVGSVTSESVTPPGTEQPGEEQISPEHCSGEGCQQPAQPLEPEITTAKPESEISIVPEVETTITEQEQPHADVTGQPEEPSVTDETGTKLPDEIATTESVESGAPLEGETVSEPKDTTTIAPSVQEPTIEEKKPEEVPPVTEIVPTTETQKTEAEVTHEEEKPSFDGSIEDESDHVTTEKEEIQFVTEIPTAETKKPQSMDHVFETSAPESTSVKPDSEIHETEKSVDAQTTETNIYATEVPSSETTHPDILKSETEHPVEVVTELSENKTEELTTENILGITEAVSETVSEISVTGQDESNEIPDVVESCTKENCAPQGQIPQSEGGKETSIVPESPAPCDSEHDCVPTAEKEGIIETDKVPEKETPVECNSENGCPSPGSEKESHIPEVTVPESCDNEVECALAVTEKEINETTDTNKVGEGPISEPCSDKTSCTPIIPGKEEIPIIEGELPESTTTSDEVVTNIPQKVTPIEEGSGQLPVVSEATEKPEEIEGSGQDIEGSGQKPEDTQHTTEGSGEDIEGSGHIPTEEAKPEQITEESGVTHTEEPVGHDTTKATPSLSEGESEKSTEGEQVVTVTPSTFDLGNEIEPESTSGPEQIETQTPGVVSSEGTQSPEVITEGTDTPDIFTLQVTETVHKETESPEQKAPEVTKTSEDTATEGEIPEVTEASVSVAPEATQTPEKAGTQGPDATNIPEIISTTPQEVSPESTQTPEHFEPEGTRSPYENLPGSTLTSKQEEAEVTQSPEKDIIIATEIPEKITPEGTEYPENVTPEGTHLPEEVSKDTQAFEETTDITTSGYIIPEATEISKEIYPAGTKKPHYDITESTESELQTSSESTTVPVDVVPENTEYPEQINTDATKGPEDVVPQTTHHIQDIPTGSTQIPEEVFKGTQPSDEVVSQETQTPEETVFATTEAVDKVPDSTQELEEISPESTVSSVDLGAGETETPEGTHIPEEIVPEGTYAPENLPTEKITQSPEQAASEGTIAPGQGSPEGTKAPESEFPQSTQSPEIPESTYVPEETPPETSQAPDSKVSETETTETFEQTQPTEKIAPEGTQLPDHTAASISEFSETTQAPVQANTESEIEEEEHGIPGEGNCLVDGQTYKNNSNVPPINQCQTSCRCVSSILQCESVSCTPPPNNLQDCMPIFHSPDSCCPVYSCSVPGVTSMESDSHVVETTTVGQEEDKPVTIGIQIIPNEEVTDKSSGVSISSEETTTTKHIEEETGATERLDTITETSNVPVHEVTTPKSVEEETIKPEISESLTTETTESETEKLPEVDTDTEVSVVEAVTKESAAPGSETVPSVETTDDLVATKEVPVTTEPSAKPVEGEQPVGDEIENEIPIVPEHCGVEGCQVPVSPTEVSQVNETAEGEIDHTVPSTEEAITERHEEPNTGKPIVEPTETTQTEVTESVKESELSTGKLPAATEQIAVDELSTTEHTIPSEETSTDKKLPESSSSTITEQPEEEISTSETEGPKISDQGATVPESDYTKLPEYVTEPTIVLKPSDEDHIPSDTESPVTEKVHEELSTESEETSESATEAISQETKSPEEIAAIPEIEEAITSPSILPAPVTETMVEATTPSEKLSEDVLTEQPVIVDNVIPEGKLPAKPEITTEVQETETKPVDEIKPTDGAPAHDEGPTESQPEIRYPDRVSMVQTTESHETVEHITELDESFTSKPIETADHVTEVVEEEIEKTVTPIIEVSSETTSKQPVEEITDVTDAIVTSVPQKESKPEEEPVTEPQTESKPEVESVTEPQEESKPEGEPVTEPQEEGKPEDESVTEPQVESKPEGEPVTEPQEEGKPEGEPVTEPQEEGKLQDESVTEPQEESKPEGEPVTEPQEEGKPEDESVTEPQEESKPEGEPVTEPQEEGKPEDESVTEPEEESKPEGEPVTEPQEESKPEGEPVTESQEEGKPEGESVTGPQEESKLEGEPITESHLPALPILEEEKGKPSESEFATEIGKVTESTLLEKETEKEGPITPVTEGGITTVKEHVESVTDKEKDVTQPEEGEFPTHAPIDKETEAGHIPSVTEKETVTAAYVTTETSIAETAKSETEAAVPTEKGEEGMYTSPQLTTQAPSNVSELYTSGFEELSTKKSVAGELSTSPTVAAAIPTAGPSTSAPAYVPPPVPGHEIPGEHVPDIPDYQSPADDYEDEDQSPLGPGTCRYGGKVYVSAQQIPRDDPCDFCFCFRSDIICLQQSCPPPIPKCHEEPIRGFCCPRYECPVGMATAVNVTTSTTTTTTTLPPHFLSHAYKGRVTRSGCQIRGRAYQVGDEIRSASGPCLHCTCGGDGEMKCDPKACSPEPMLRQMIAAAASRRRR